MFLDLTSHITLRGRDRSVYVIARLILLVLFVALAITVALRIMFPSAYFHFDMNRANALDNTMNIPMATTSTDDTDRLAFSANTIGDYMRAHIELTLTDDARTQLADDTTFALTAHKGYDILFDAPVMPRAITAELADRNPALGELFAYRNGIFVVEHMRDADTGRTGPFIRAIDDVRTFEAKGWNFDVVRDDITSDDVADLDKAKMFTMRDHHPVGTVFYDTRSHAHLLLTRDSTRALALTKIDASDVTDTTPVVVIDYQATALETAPCTLAPHTFSLHKRVLTCNLSLAALTAPGSDIVFYVEGLTPEMIEYVAIRLDAARSADTLRTSLGLIKQRLSQQYTD